MLKVKVIMKFLAIIFFDEVKQNDTYFSVLFASHSFLILRLANLGTVICFPQHLSPRDG
mgnify:CR=1 FL=1